MSDINVPRTKDLLNKNNYRLWRQQIRLLLNRIRLNKYINYQILNKIDGSSMSAEQRKKLIQVDDKINTYYEEGTKEDDIINDFKTKEILMNSMENELAVNMDFISSTAYEVFNTIKSINISSDKDRIQELKDSLDNALYDPEGDIPLPIFISNMNIKFKELENLKAGLDFQDKFDYLYNSIPEELASKSNLLCQEKNWEEITQHLINTAQHLRRLKIKKEQVAQRNNTESNLVTSKTNKNYKNIYQKKHKDKPQIRCWNCGKIGHYKEDCYFRNNKRYKEDYKGKGKSHKNNGRRSGMRKQ